MLALVAGWCAGYGGHLACPDGGCAMTLPDCERTRCEVWTRVMGYHRPVTAFNPGKQAEHFERRLFREPPGCLTNLGAISSSARSKSGLDDRR